MNDLKTGHFRELIKAGKLGEIDEIGLDQSATAKPIETILGNANRDTLDKCLEVLSLIEQSNTHNSVQEPESLRLLELLESGTDLDQLLENLIPNTSTVINQNDPFGTTVEDFSTIEENEQTQTIQSIQNIRQKLRNRAKSLLQDQAVKKTFLSLLKSEVALLTGSPNQDKSKTPLGVLKRVNYLKSAKERLQQKLTQIFRKEAKNTNSVPATTMQVVGQLSQKIKEASQEEQKLSSVSDDVTQSWLYVNKLKQYKQDLQKFGFAITPSRRALIDRVLEGVTNGEKMFLVGSTGTGKTQLAVLVATLVNEHGYELVSWHGDTTPRDLFGYREIKKDEQGNIVSGTKPGPVTIAITEGKIVIHDEYNNGPLKTHLSAKAQLNAKPGSQTKIAGFEGEMITVTDNFGEIFTGNPKNEKTTKDREELDPAINRMLSGLKVDFMPQSEMFEVVLASFIDDTGILMLSVAEVELIRKLTEAASLMQKCHNQEFSSLDEKVKNTLALAFGGDIAEVQLNKNFLDTGTLLRILSGFQFAKAKGISFATFLKTKLEEFVNDPKFADAEDEKNLVRKIFENTGLSDIKDQKSAQPFILPSQIATKLGIIKEKSKKSDDEEPENPEKTGNPAIEKILQQNSLSKLAADYSDSKATMDMFELTAKARTPQPTFEQIKPKLTPEMLERIKHLHHPKLVCVPTRTKGNKPIRYQELAKALDKAKADGKTDKVHTGGSTYVWSEIEDGSKVSYRKGNQKLTQEEYFKQGQDWEVWIVESPEEMPDPATDPRYATDFPKNGTSQEKHDYMLSKYKSLNLEGLTYETWIVLLMDALRKQGKIDVNTYTDLLNNDLAVQNSLAAAGWNNSKPVLGSVDADCQNASWRSRGTVRVM
jgi:MoxR-like ATPase